MALKHADKNIPLHEVEPGRLPLTAIRIDGGTQPRGAMDGGVVIEYREQMQEGTIFPPITVFYDGADYWLADGFHRVDAAKIAGLTDIAADVRQGTQRDAILYSVGANAAHGLRRTNYDKRRAVERLLRDEEWAQWSDREIARKCAVSDRFVNNLRKDLSANGSQINSRTVQRGGTTYTQNTANIGKSSPPVQYGKIEDDYQPDVPEVQVDGDRSDNKMERQLGGRDATVQARSGQVGILVEINGRDAIVDTPNGRKNWDALYLKRVDAPAAQDDASHIRLEQPSNAVWKAEVSLNGQLKELYLPHSETPIDRYHEIKHHFVPPLEPLFVSVYLNGPTQSGKIALGPEALKAAKKLNCERAKDYSVIWIPANESGFVDLSSLKSVWTYSHHTEWGEDDGRKIAMKFFPHLFKTSPTPPVSADLSERAQELGADATLIEGVNYKRDSKVTRAANEYEPQGYDACQTPAYAIDPLLPHLTNFLTIWEPAAGEGLLVEALYDSELSANPMGVIASDILTGQNFFDYEPEHAWDCIVTNPPFSLKFKWLERCYQLGKPFALLLPVETLAAATAQKMFAEYGIEVIFMNKRINFKMPNKGWDGAGAQFGVAWFTWGLGIGKEMSFAEIENNDDPE